jgi:hypothetical protein
MLGYVCSFSNDPDLLDSTESDSDQGKNWKPLNSFPGKGHDGSKKQANLSKGVHKSYSWLFGLKGHMRKLLKIDTSFLIFISPLPWQNYQNHIQEN